MLFSYCKISTNLPNRRYLLAAAPSRWCPTFSVDLWYLWERRLWSPQQKYVEYKTCLNKWPGDRHHVRFGQSVKIKAMRIGGRQQICHRNIWWLAHMSLIFFTIRWNNENACHKCNLLKYRTEKCHNKKISTLNCLENTLTLTKINYTCTLHWSLCFAWHA